MNKLTLNLAGVLLFIYVLLSLLSLGGDYSAERELWGINRKFDYIGSHLESIPDYAIDQLEKSYQDFISRYHGTIYAKRAFLMMGDLYSLRKNYPQARLEYQKVIGPDKELSAQAQFAIGRTYEFEGDWDKALVLYKVILKDYPVTSLGFSTPMYLTNHLVASGDQKVYTDEAYADALAFYQGIAVKYPKSRIEYNALRMATICQLNQKDWSGTVRTMGEIILKYPFGKAIQEAVGAINLLCVTKLHDYDMGISIYRRFIQKYPDHPGDPILKKMIKDLQLLKDRKLIIKTER